VCPPGSENDLCRTIAYKEAEKQSTEANKDLIQVGPSWVTATGYVSVWERVYRAEEALIEVVPQEAVLSGAVYDESRLQGSKIEPREELLAKLRQAVAVIDPGAGQYLAPPSRLMAPLAISTPSQLPEGPVNTLYTQTLVATGGVPPYKWTTTGAPAWLALTETTGQLTGTPAEAKTFKFTVRVTDSTSQMKEEPFTLTIKDTPASPGPPASPPSNTDPKKVARAVLRTVRRSINEFRNASWNGLILARNHLLTTMIYTGITVFVLLAIAMVWGASRPAVFAASVFYLVGATTGLGDRLRRESQADVAIEDYGLSTARLITIPLFSGLGAVGGVVLVAMLPFSSTVLGPRTPAPPGPSPLAISTPSPLAEREVAKAYSETLQATGGAQPYKWTISEGAIPDALVLGPTGVLSGTPTNAGTGNFGVRVTDSLGATVEKRFALPVKPPTKQDPLAIDTTSPLSGGVVGKDYSERLQAVGGKPPYTWTLKGPRPDGLELSPAGVLSGKPTAAKTSSFTVQVTDSGAPTAAAIERPFDLPVTQSEQASPVGAVTKSSPDRSPAEQIPPLVKIFDLGENLIGLLVAAVFGLTPGLLFDRLQQQSDKYKADLKSSQATEGTPKS
jgi:hypothetical protein